VIQGLKFCIFEIRYYAMSEIYFYVETNIGNLN